MAKNVVTEIITTQIGETNYTGSRVLTGIRIKYQTIHYENLKKDDATMIKKDRENIALSRARTILGELVKEYHGMDRLSKNY